MSVARERVVGAEQQPVVSAASPNAVLVAAEEVGDVVGNDGPLLVDGAFKHDAVVDASQVGERSVLHGDDVMTTEA